MIDSSERLVVSGIAKDYAERVLDDVDLTLSCGEVHALLGANGAGKSTLCHIVAGLTAPSEGRMWIDGEPFSPADRLQAEAAGVRIVQQHLSLIPTLSVAENLRLANLPRRFGWVNRTELHRVAHEALARVEMTDLDPDRAVGELGIGTQQLIEIARALAADCRVMILDEPTAALTERETQVMFRQVERLRADGVAVIYVSHRLDEVRSICDRWTVLRDGRRVADGSMATTTNREVVELMAGTAANHRVDFTSYATQDVVLDIQDLTRPGKLDGVGLSLRRGERLGIAGLVGAGRSELLRALYGADPASGTMILKGVRRALFKHPREAVAAGMVMVTEDRQFDGLLLDQSIRCNLTLAGVPTRNGFVAAGVEVERTNRRLAALDTRYRHTEQPVRELSGGNQQKVVLGRWLEIDADIYLLDEPTRGIDVAARAQILGLIEDLAARGKGVVIVSSDVDELLMTCDVILVLADGRVADVMDRRADRPWTRETIVAASFAQSRGVDA